MTPNETATLDWGSNTASVLKRVIEAANASTYGARIILSIGMCSTYQYEKSGSDYCLGGWEGSQWFSYAVSTAANRVTFVQALANVMKEYDLAGELPLEQLYVSDLVTVCRFQH